jgi:hypothetical protein
LAFFFLKLHLLLVLKDAPFLAEEKKPRHPDINRAKQMLLISDVPFINCKLSSLLQKETR